MIRASSRMRDPEFPLAGCIVLTKDGAPVGFGPSLAAEDKNQVERKRGKARLQSIDKSNSLLSEVKKREEGKDYLLYS